MTKIQPDRGDERLADWLDGRMSPRDLERFEAEMRVSKALREKAESYARTARAVKDAFSVPGPRIDLADAVLGRLRDGESPKPVEAATAAPIGGRVLPFPRSRPSAWVWSGLVACGMVATVMLLDSWQPAVTTESAALDGGPAPSAAPQPRTDDFYIGTPIAGSAEGAPPGDELRANLQGSEPDRSSRYELEQKETQLGGEASTLEERSQPGQWTETKRQADPAGAADPGAVGAKPEAQMAKREGGAADLGTLQDSARERSTPSTPLTFGAVPRTAVPTVRLRRVPEPTGGAGAPTPGGPTRSNEAAKAKDAPPRAGRRGAAADSTNLFAGAVELDRALGNVQVFRLPSVPGAETQDKDAALRTGAAAASQAWLVEGPPNDVQAFLATLSEAGRARGYEIVNGEVSVTELQAVDPSLPAVPGARFVPRAPASRKPEEAPDSAGGLSGPVGGGDGTGPEAGTDAARRLRSGSGGPGSPGPAGPAGAAPEPSSGTGGGGGGAMLVLPVRVVVVIDPAK